VPLRAGLVSAAVATLAGVLVAGPWSALAWLTIAATEDVPDTVDNASFPGLAMRFLGSPVLGLVAGVAVLVGTLVWVGRHRDRVDPAGTAPWSVVAAGLLLSPIAWHNYLLLLVPGVLVLVTLRRNGLAAALLAVAVIPVSWTAIWPPEPGPLIEIGSDVGRSLYCAILVAYWVALLSAAPLRSDPADGPATPGAPRPSAVGSSDAATG